MRALDAVVLTLRANAEAEAGGGAGMPIGRTALQKLVYFVSLDMDVDAWFYAHYYGPFSEDVSMEIARLWGHGLIREDAPTRTKPGCTYTLTKGGLRLGEKVAGENGAEYARIASIVEMCRDFCGLRQLQLAFAAKSHYLRTRKNAPHAGPSELSAMGSKIGWVMSEDDVNSGLELLRRLGHGDGAAA